MRKPWNPGSQTPPCNIYIYIYIYVCVCVCVFVCVCVCVCVCVWLNNKATFCLYNFIKILSSFLISVLVSGWNWWMNLPKINNYWEKINTLNIGDRDTFGKFIHRFQPKTKTLISNLESILMKLYEQNVSLLFH